MLKQILEALHGSVCLWAFMIPALALWAVVAGILETVFVYWIVLYIIAAPIYGLYWLIKRPKA